jgi:hypothetical protein
MNSDPKMLIEKLYMLTSTHVTNEQKVLWLKLWNQSNVLRETRKFSKHGFSNGTFDKWLYKATFWSQVNDYQFKPLNLLSFKWLQIDIQHIAVGGGRTKIICCHCHWFFYSAFGILIFPFIIRLHSKMEIVVSGKFVFLGSSSLRMGFKRVSCGSNRSMLSQP